MYIILLLRVRVCVGVRRARLICCEGATSPESAVSENHYFVVIPLFMV